MKLNVGNAKLQKAFSNTSITDGNENYSVASVFFDKDCTQKLATLTTDESENINFAEITAGTVYIWELSVPLEYQVEDNVYFLHVESGKTAILHVSDTPNVSAPLIEVFKIDNVYGLLGLLLVSDIGLWSYCLIKKRK